MTITWRYPTSPLRRWFFRLPITAYRFGMGRLMAGWSVSPQVRMGILLLTTTGRTSGRPRTTPVEYREAQGRYYLVSAWGRRSDWLRNIEQDPRVHVQAARRQEWCRARLVTSPEGREESYGVWVRANPKAAARFFRMMGLPADASEDERQRLFEQLTLVVLEPEQPR